MKNLVEERKYERLRELGKELHLPIPEAFIELEVFDKDGRLIQRHNQRSHSWVRNTYNMIFSMVAGKDADDVTYEGGKLSTKDTDGNIKNAAKPIDYGGNTVDAPPTAGYRAAAAEHLWGIIVGSGTNAEDFEDFTLQTQIVEGAGAGQLNHVASEAHAISYAALTLKNTLIRYLNNNSGGSIDVEEVAIVSYLRGPTAGRCVMSRDKLASTVAVPDTGQLKVTYTIQLVYPS